MSFDLCSLLFLHFCLFRFYLLKRIRFSIAPSFVSAFHRMSPLCCCLFSRYAIIWLLSLLLLRLFIISMKKSNSLFLAFDSSYFQLAQLLALFVHFTFFVPSPPPFTKYNPSIPNMVIWPLDWSLFSHSSNNVNPILFWAAPIFIHRIYFSFSLCHSLNLTLCV